VPVTIREALEYGLLRLEPVGDKGDRTVTLDGSFTLWCDPRRPYPYRWARTDIPTHPEQASSTEGSTRYGGCDTLQEALRVTVLLRSQGCREG
jgi:hypothetical protein